jgi:hypothetical protein
VKRNRILLFVAAGTVLLVSGSAQAQFSPNVLPFAPPSVSTVPSTGDTNPYGVAYVPASVPADGLLQPGDILVANFNGPSGIQGTGTTIVRVSATGQTSLFFQSLTGKGLTGALGILSNGIVIVGNLPTTDGTVKTAGPGALTFIDRFGGLLGVIEGDGIHGPWGMAVADPGAGIATVFVSQVLTGYIGRYTISYDKTGFFVHVDAVALVGSGFAHQPNAGAVVLGPSGLAYDAIQDILYVASSNDNAVYSIANAASRTTAGTGTVIYNDATHLHGPLDLAWTPTGHLLVANSDGSNADPAQPSELVEFTVGGAFVSQFSVDPNLGGAFGLATFPISTGALNVLRVAAVDDNANTLDLWTSIVQ